MMGVFSAFAKPFLDCCLGEGQKLSWVSLRKESPHLAGFCVQQNAANTDNLHGSKAPFARGLIVAVFAPLCRVVADGSTRCHRAKTSTSGTRGRAGCLPFSTGDATKSTSGRSGWHCRAWCRPTILYTYMLVRRIKVSGCVCPKARSPRVVSPQSVCTSIGCEQANRVCLHSNSHLPLLVDQNGFSFLLLSAICYLLVSARPDRAA